MERFFNRFMIIVFTVSLSLAISLSAGLLILGPHKLDHALRALFVAENYTEDYKKYPSLLRRSIPSNKEGTTRDILEAQQVILDKTKIPALIVPTTGIAPRKQFLFTGKLTEGLHEGIDIWTNIYGKGSDGKTYSRGNPVYAACSGIVNKIWKENGDVQITCEEIDPIYESLLPSRNILTVYGHMADKGTGTVFINVKEHQQVKKGELIGYQGNQAYYSPQNLMVHLHFGIYDLNTHPIEPLDPTPYIGVSCTTLNQTFTAGV